MMRSVRTIFSIMFISLFILLPTTLQACGIATKQGKVLQETPTTPPLSPPPDEAQEPVTTTALTATQAIAAALHAITTTTIAEATPPQTDLSVEATVAISATVSVTESAIVPSSTVALSSIPANFVASESFPSAELEELFNRTGGTYGVVVYDVDNEQLLYVRNGTEVFSAASLIKIPIAIAAYRAATQGVIHMDEQLVMDADDIVGGSGSLQYAAPGSVYTLRDLCSRMIYDSDNTAANMIIHHLGGLDVVNNALQELDINDTHVQRYLMDMEALYAGRDNLTTPADMLLMLRMLAQEQIAGSAAILQSMQQTTDRQKLPALLPAGTIVQHKTGTLANVEHDAGIVETQQGHRYIALFLSSDLPSNEAGIAAIAEASRLVYNALDLVSETQPEGNNDISPVPLPVEAVPAQSLTYVFPVQAEWVNYGPYHHDYPAADIFCPIGSAFLATTSGTIDFVNAVDLWDPATNIPADRGGMMVAMIGDDGVRYYGSHLSGVAEGIVPGVRVEAGQVLGWTGNSGNALYTDPHLHYGISCPTTPDDWETRRGQFSPYEYLVAWQQGEHMAVDVCGD